LHVEVDGEPVQLLQTKHHVTHTGSLTDSSSDLWKTLRVWAVSARSGLFDLDSVILSLVTTASAPADSAAALLRSGTGRNVLVALDKLRMAGEASTSAIVRQSFDEFQALSPLEQEKLLSCIRVLDIAPDITWAPQLLEDRLRYSTRQQFLSGLCDRLEGWWFSRAVEHLKNPDLIKGIPQRLVQVQINDLAEQFRLDNLPNDFPFPVDLDESDLSSNERNELLNWLILGDTTEPLVVRHPEKGEIAVHNFPLAPSGSLSLIHLEHKTGERGAKALLALGLLVIS
jgi:hypothetical protein